MRAVVQRVSQARVDVDGRVVGEIGTGLCVLLGVTHHDGADRASKMAARIAGLRIFDDKSGVMNLPVADAGGSVLVISQFTLYGDTGKGRRPSYVQAAQAEHAEPLVQAVIDELRKLDLRVETGEFRADMQVKLVNEGPVTLMIEV